MASERSAAPSEQRIFSLVLALVASQEGATKSDLLSSVYGYAERYAHGQPNVALDRQFERDKEQLRALGIRIETLDSPLEPGNNQLTRYRISKDQLQVPRDLSFDERELMLMRLAALAWREGSLSAESRRAAMKLESLGAALDVQHLGVAPRLGAPEQASAPLQGAIDARASVRFRYEVPGRDSALERHVAPLRLHRAEGRWHLIAWDIDRGAGRVFLLSRIRGTVDESGDAFDPSLLQRADGIVSELLSLEKRQRAQLTVRPGSRAEARLEPRAASAQDVAGRGVLLDVGTLDYRELCAELVGYGPDVSVQGPEELRESVVQALERMAIDHG